MGITRTVSSSISPQRVSSSRHPGSRSPQVRQLGLPSPIRSFVEPKTKGLRARNQGAYTGQRASATSQELAVDNPDAPHPLLGSILAIQHLFFGPPCPCPVSLTSQPQGPPGLRCLSLRAYCSPCACLSLPGRRGRRWTASSGLAWREAIRDHVYPWANMCMGRNPPHTRAWQ